MNIAKHLSKQGNRVFISSHKQVREELEKISDECRVITVTPSLELKDKWIEKLHARYKESKLEKDKKAYLNAKDMYEENIKDILNDNFDHIKLKEMDYCLKDILNCFV